MGNDLKNGLQDLIPEIWIWDPRGHRFTSIVCWEIQWAHRSMGDFIFAMSSTIIMYPSTLTLSRDPLESHTWPSYFQIMMITCMPFVNETSVPAACLRCYSVNWNQCLFMHQMTNRQLPIPKFVPGSDPMDLDLGSYGIKDPCQVLADGRKMT